MTPLYLESLLREHNENLQKAFQVIKESGLKLKKEKCEIKKDKLTYF